MLPTVAPDPPLNHLSRQVGTCRSRRYYRPRGELARPSSAPPIPGRRGGSWRPESTSTAPAWSGAARWLDSLRSALEGPAGELQRRRVSIRLETVLDVAAEDARAADSRTGRHVTTAHATVAALLGCSAKTVQRARALIETLGHARTVVSGRYLTTDERTAARLAHGGDQRRMASERALTVPQPLPNVQLPRRGAVCLDLKSRSGLPKHAPARAREGQTRPGKTKTRQQRQIRPLAVQLLAAGLAQRLPWLARGHVGTLCDALTALGVDRSGWTAQDVIDQLDGHNAAAGLYQPPVNAQRNPLGLFMVQAQRALAGVEPPVLRRRREAEARAAQRAADAAAAVLERDRMTAQAADQGAQARISAAQAAIRATLTARRHTVMPSLQPRGDLIK